MSEFQKPDIVNKEIILDSNKIIMSKTDKFGIFEFANEYFMEISGYEEYELMGKSMFCIQHPDMPEVIFKMMWEKLLKKIDFHVVVKNIAKSGKYYWSITNFTFKTDEDGEIIAIYSKRIAANRESVTYFSKLYKTLLNIEKENGIDASERYLIGFLEERRLKFNELVDSFYTEMFSETRKPDEPIISIPKEINSKNKTTSISIELNEKPLISKKIDKNTHKLQELQKQVEDVVKKTSKESDKKSLFQRMFGKTDEEIEEDRKRKAKK